MYNTVVGQTGPLVVRRLESYGKLESLVVGPWGEGNKDLHSLVKTLKRSRLLPTPELLGGRLHTKSWALL